MVLTAELGRVILPGPGKDFAQRRGIAGVGAIELGVPVGLLRAGEGVDAEDAGRHVVVHRQEADAELVGDVLEGEARARLHHQHAVAVVAEPVGEVLQLRGVALRERQRGQRHYRRRARRGDHGREVRGRDRAGDRHHGARHRRRVAGGADLRLDVARQRAGGCAGRVHRQDVRAADHDAAHRGGVGGGRPVLFHGEGGAALVEGDYQHPRWATEGSGPGLPPEPSQTTVTRFWSAPVPTKAL